MPASHPVLDGVPILQVDHHRPQGVPEGAALIAGHSHEPTLSSSLPACWAAEMIAEIADLLRIAVVDSLDDRGNDAP